MPFVTALVLREVIGESRSWRLDRNLVYLGNVERWIVPAGFMTDLGSAPWFTHWFLPPAGDSRRAYVLHDWLYKSGAVSRADADGIMRRVMRELGVGRVRRYSAWAGVRMFGWLAWRGHRKADG